MNRKIHPITIAIMLSVISALSLNAQDYSEAGKTYFRQNILNKGPEALIRHLPNLEDCKLVFNGTNPYTYYGFLEEMKKNWQENTQSDTSHFVDVLVSCFSTQDIDQGKGNYAGGMTKTRPKLNPYVLFYKVTLTRKLGDDYGNSMKYWVNINGRWVYFPGLHSFH
jgi:hypothetical protein